MNMRNLHDFFVDMLVGVRGEGMINSRICMYAFIPHLFHIFICDILWLCCVENKMPQRLGYFARTCLRIGWARWLCLVTIVPFVRWISNTIFNGFPNTIVSNSVRCHPNVNFKRWISKLSLKPIWIFFMVVMDHSANFWWKPRRGDLCLPGFALHLRDASVQGRGGEIFGIGLV